jgi:hypothetical protein
MCVHIDWSRWPIVCLHNELWLVGCMAGAYAVVVKRHGGGQEESTKTAALRCVYISFRQDDLE